MCNTLDPFSMATCPSLIVCLYLAYSKLLKFTRCRMQVMCMEKLVILDEYLIDHCWMLACDHHLNHRLSLSHVSRRRRRPRVGAINDVHPWMARPVGHASADSCMTQVTEAMSKTNCSKTILAPPTWRPLKISPPKVKWRNPRRPMGQSSTMMQIFTPIRARCLSPGNKYVFSL